jgi:hypothetical protein
MLSDPVYRGQSLELCAADSPTASHLEREQLAIAAPSPDSGPTDFEISGNFLDRQ